MLRFTTLSGRFEAEEGKFTAFAEPDAHTLYSCDFEYRANAYGRKDVSYEIC